MDADSTRRLPKAPPAGARGERRMDQWIRRSLSEAHDEVLTERLPPSWIAMIDETLPPS